METLRASVDALAARLAGEGGVGEGGVGVAVVEKTEESLERSSFPAAEMFANRATAAGVDASRIPEVSFRPLALSAGTTSRRHAPWFPEVATRITNGVSGFEPATAGVRNRNAHPPSPSGDGGARGGGSRARARDEREREAADRDGTGFVSAAEDAASTFASRREGASASERLLKEGEKEKARAEAREARASPRRRARRRTRDPGIGRFDWRSSRRVTNEPAPGSRRRKPDAKPPSANAKSRERPSRDDRRRRNRGCRTSGCETPTPGRTKKKSATRVSRARGSVPPEGVK